MDPSTPLDHALFHLTPTRTRCDLLAVPPGRGAAKEKIASGLLEPFLAHLRSARDQIPKGGYSFTLRPPPPREGNGGNRWFTKGTLERFVRFVATPEILERVVTIEKEIVQIEESIHREDANSSTHHTDRDAATSLAVVPAANGSAKPAASSKSNDEHDKQDAANGENSKVCLLRALENRKTILFKEQGMAYARASVAGFDKDTIDDLISFADAFGATRLREACVSFLEVCKEKEKDKMWMDELAALEASRQSQLSYLAASGIMLTADNNENNLGARANSVMDGHQGQNGSNEDPTSNPAANGMSNASWNQGHFMVPNLGNHNFPMGWPNHPPFPGYAYPGMPFMQPYPGYSDGWPPRNDDERSQIRGKSGKLHRSSETGFSSKDNYSDDNNSDPESESDEKDISTDVDSSRKNQRHKKSNKKSSRMVVIRNINYITSKGRHEENDSSDKSSTNDVLDGDFLRRNVEDIVGSLDKHETTNQHHRKRGEQRNASINDSSDVDDIDMKQESNNKISNQGWDAFQNILLREEPDTTAEYCMIKSDDVVVSPSSNNQLDGEYKKSIKPKAITADPIVGTTKSIDFERNGNLENFEHDENRRRYMRKSYNTDEELLFSQRGKDEADPLSGVPYSEESSKLKGHREGDWYAIADTGRKGDNATGRDSFFPEDNQVENIKDQHLNKGKLDVVADDSFIAPVRAVATEKQPFSLWETDMSIISGVASGVDNMHSPTKSKENNGNLGFHEPEELQLMLGRNLEVEHEHLTPSWTPEIDYSVSLAHGDASEKNYPIEGSQPTDNKLSTNGKDAKSKLKPANGGIKSTVSSKTFSKNKLEALSRPRTVSSLNKRGVLMSKAEKEEAERKRVEGQLLERQRRIAQRSASNSTTSLSRQSSSVEAKSAVASPRQDKKTPVSKVQGSQPAKQNGLVNSMKQNHPTQVKV